MTNARIDKITQSRIVRSFTMFLFPHGISIEVLYIMIRAIDILVVISILCVLSIFVGRGMKGKKGA